jgi:monovalent cation/hydrogen antiporter
VAPRRWRATDLLLMATFETLLVLLAAPVGLVALVLGCMALAFVPGLPTIELEPELALAPFPPPLLLASAYRTYWNTFRVSLRARRATTGGWSSGSASA